ncbi:extensin-like domain-containing protein [Devosia sp. A449]
MLAQDFLGPLNDFVETLTAPKPAPPAPSRPAPKVVAPTVATPPPVPRPRPPSLPEAPQVTPPQVEPEQKPETEAEPEATQAAEPARIYQVACPAVLLGLVAAEMAPPLSEEACGEQSPLVVTGVLSRGRMVKLSTPITTNCQMASALPRWVETVDGYAEAMLGSALAAVNTGTSYMCRKRNNAAAGFVSEHGFANAVDVTGFTLADGRSIDVTANWLPAAQPEGRLLRLAHDAGCAGFTTTLGPEANAEHADHLHLDLGCHGASCEARICE